MGVFTALRLFRGIQAPLLRAEPRGDFKLQLRVRRHDLRDAPRSGGHLVSILKLKPPALAVVTYSGVSSLAGFCGNPALGEIELGSSKFKIRPFRKGET